jgi:hypothetical protein
MPPARNMAAHSGNPVIEDKATTGAYNATPMYRDMYSKNMHAAIAFTNHPSYLSSKY